MSVAFSVTASVFWLRIIQRSDPALELSRFMGAAAPVPAPAGTRVLELTAPVSLEWSAEGALENLTSARANDALSVRGAVTEGQEQWLETLIALENPFFVAEDRLACAARFATPIRKTCVYELVMVVNRINEYEGEIVYGRARSVPPEEAEIPAERIDEGCRSYIGCLAHIRIGTKLPIPDARWSSVAISQHLQSHWRAPELADVRQLPEIIDAYKIGYSGLVAARDAGTRTGALAEAKIRKAEQMIRYLRLRCQELSRNANFPTACPKT